MTDPRTIVMMGDLHANTRWTENAIFQAHKLVAGEDQQVIVQVGDFGVFSDAGGDYFLQRVSSALELFDMQILVVPGNHEDYDRIDSWATPNQLPFNPVVQGETLHRIKFLPRGYRWQWHGRTWLACGGAASPDRYWRTENEYRTGIKTWWPQENITDADIKRCADGGPADILVCHDRPARARLELPPWPRGWTEADYARCERSRDKVQAVCDAVQPAWVIHGHYHLPFSSARHDLGYDMAIVSQLNMDGFDDNYRLLDVEAMLWL